MIKVSDGIIERRLYHDDGRVIENKNPRTRHQIFSFKIFAISF